MVGADGNQQAHDAARECLLTSPPLISNPPPAPTPATWHLHRQLLQQESRKRLQEITPQGFLPAEIPLRRQEEIFINKAYANAAYTPDVIRKWYNGATSLTSSPTCTFCGQATTPNLYHLIWHCPTFGKGRAALLDKWSPPPDAHAHLELLRSNPSLLGALGQYALISGLFKAV